MRILDRLIEERKSKKITLLDISGRIGITAQTLGRYERGDRIIPYHILEKYAECLGYELKLMVK